MVEPLTWFQRHFLQAPVPAWATPAWSTITLASALSRSQDYLTRGSGDGAGLLIGVRELGLATWGWAFALLVAGIVVGLLLLASPWRWRWPLVVIHTAGLGLFVSYAVALAQGDLDGRGSLVLLLPVVNAAAHLLCAILYVPPRPGMPRG